MQPRNCLDCHVYFLLVCFLVEELACLKAPDMLMGQALLKEQTNINF